MLNEKYQGLSSVILVTTRHRTHIYTHISVIAGDSQHLPAQQRVSVPTIIVTRTDVYPVQLCVSVPMSVLTRTEDWQSHLQCTQKSSDNVKISSASNTQKSLKGPLTSSPNIKVKKASYQARDRKKNVHLKSLMHKNDSMCNMAVI